MMKKQVFYIFILLTLCSQFAYSQLDSINYLDEVVVSDLRLYKSSGGNRLQVLKDSTLEQNAASLGSLLKFNSPIYFKENGAGMVSSAAFRGTTAAQTAVVWNGININSQFNGQTDFNTLLSSGYDKVVVRSGGGSVLYGSGAIGGSVHLNNELKFGSGFKNQLRLKAGSFSSFFGNYSGKYSSEVTSVEVKLSRNSSDNDFEYLGTDKFNENGDYQNTSVNAAAAFLLSDQNLLKFYTNYYDGERGFSGTLSIPSKSKYEDINSRNLLEWEAYLQDFTSNLSLAYLDETYRYFENRENEVHSFGRAKTGIVKYDLEYRLNNNMSISALADLQQTRGEGTNIGNATRTTGSAGMLFLHELQDFYYELSARKEFSDKYNSPLLFALNSGYRVSSNYDLRFNFSRNYRIPTFNDLFWYAGGDQTLEPEESLQTELGQDLHFGHFNISLTGYWIRIENLLRWVPQNNGLWKPENTKSVSNFGAEFLANWQQKIGKAAVKFYTSYAYTRSRDRDLEKELIYVPKHKATANLAFGLQRFSGYYQFLYNGSVYTSSDNYYELDAYLVSNLGVEYDFLKKHGSIGFEIRNLWNENYQSMPSRPMPGRAYYTLLTLNF
ncbi:MAG: TonB-dependent receptor [Salinimicrobium sp.]